MIAIKSGWAPTEGAVLNYFCCEDEMKSKIDHLLWAAPDLSSGMAAFEQLSGVKSAIGGTHPGFGTRNALLSLDDRYFEIISPDPSQDLEATLGETIAALSSPKLFTFAIACDDLIGAADVARAAGLGVGDVIAMSRTRPDDGVRLDWSVLRLEHPDWGGRFPFLIDWQGSPHPSASTPDGATLERLEIVTPDPEPLAALYDKLGLDVVIVGGVEHGYVARLSTPKGPVVLL